MYYPLLALGQAAGFIRPICQSKQVRVGIWVVLRPRAIMAVVMAVRSAMDMTLPSWILILTPVLMPVVRAAGIGPLYFV